MKVGDLVKLSAAGMNTNWLRWRYQNLNGIVLHVHQKDERDEYGKKMREGDIKVHWFGAYHSYYMKVSVPRSAVKFAR
mgnify:FL=1|tara:strand:+ start:707 stop:940 length:234 start_codon:yes stop_codon:yes gene_type:complete